MTSQSWRDDEETLRGLGHNKPLAECIERYKAVCERLEVVLDHLDKMNGRYDNHLLESVTYRAAVDAHTKRFDSSEKQTQWFIGVLLSMITVIVVQISTFAFLWGQMTKRVEVNTKRLDIVESDLKEIERIRLMRKTKTEQGNDS